MFELRNSFRKFRMHNILIWVLHFVFIFISSCSYCKFTVIFWFFEDIFLSCLLILKLFFKNLEIITLAIFLSFSWTWFPLDCKFVIGESFPFFRPNSCFFVLFFFPSFFLFPLRRSSSFGGGGELQFITFFSFIPTWITRNTNCFWSDTVVFGGIHLNAFLFPIPNGSTSSNLQLIPS